MNNLEVQLTCRFWLGKSRVEPGFCISNKPPDDVGVTGLQAAHGVVRVSTASFFVTGSAARHEVGSKGETCGGSFCYMHIKDTQVKVAGEMKTV